jgi:hypothetical protein
MHHLRAQFIWGRPKGAKTLLFNSEFLETTPPTGHTPYTNFMSHTPCRAACVLSTCMEKSAIPFMQVREMATL